MTSGSFAKIPESRSPLQNVTANMTMASIVETAMAYISAFLARGYFPAPIFCATKAAIACMKAAGISMINPHTFSATPIPADATRPRPLTMASSTRKEMPTRKSCRAMGTPSPVTFRMMPPSKRRSERSPKVN